MFWIWIFAAVLAGFSSATDAQVFWNRPQATMEISKAEFTLALCIHDQLKKIVEIWPQTDGISIGRSLVPQLCGDQILHYRNHLIVRGRTEDEARTMVVMTYSLYLNEAFERYWAKPNEGED